MLYFSPISFIDNLVYMGVGMLGVFMIVGIIMAATYLIANLTTKKAKKQNNE